MTLLLAYMIGMAVVAAAMPQLPFLPGTSRLHQVVTATLMLAFWPLTVVFLFLVARSAR